MWEIIWGVRKIVIWVICGNDKCTGSLLLLQGFICCIFYSFYCYVYHGGWVTEGPSNLANGVTENYVTIDAI